MSTRKVHPAVSDLRLERYRLGELPPEECQAVASRLAADPALRDRLAELDRSDRLVAATYPAHEMAQTIRRRVEESGPATMAQAAPGPRARTWLVPATVLASLCIAAVAATVWLRHPAVADETTIKGGVEAALVLHRRMGDGSEELSRGAVVRQGDQVRIGYRASGRAYGAIVSIDGRGMLTQHLPATGERSAALQPSGTVFLDFAYELDDAPRWEVFYFVTSDEPFDLEPVRRCRPHGGGRQPTVPGGARPASHLGAVLLPVE